MIYQVLAVEMFIPKMVGEAKENAARIGNKFISP